MRPVDTIREYSLLSNPRMPEKVKASIAHAAIAGSGSKRKSSLPGFLSGGSEISRLRSDYKSTKVLNLTDLGSMVANGSFDATRIHAGAQTLGLATRAIPSLPHAPR